MDGSDLNDGKPWSDADDEVLRASVAGGSGLLETATLLGRSGTPFEVYKRGIKLGLWRGRRTPTQKKTPPSGGAKVQSGNRLPPWGGKRKTANTCPQR
jgi:hypothetical protein